MTIRGCGVAVAIAVAACARAARSAPTPVFTEGVWHIRLDVDSAPSRQVPKQPISGTVNFATGRYSIDLRRVISRELANRAGVVVLPPQNQREAALYKITLGDSNSFDDKIVLLGRPVTSDSIAGTWSETILCCSAGGRFTLWRPAAPAARPRTSPTDLPEVAALRRAGMSQSAAPLPSAACADSAAWVFVPCPTTETSRNRR